MTYHCRICQRNFSTQSGLTRHANAVHHGRTTLSQTNESTYQQINPISRPEHDEGLWNRPIIIPTLTNNPTNNPIPNEDIEMGESSEDIQTITEDEPQHHYYLRSQMQNIGSPENSEDSETEINPLINLEEIDFDLENLQGASLDDALDTSEEKNKLENIAKWPNDAYRDFMGLMVENNISNKTGDKIIKFFNKYSNLKISPLPKSTKSGKDYLN